MSQPLGILSRFVLIFFNLFWTFLYSIPKNYMLYDISYNIEYRVNMIREIQNNIHIKDNIIKLESILIR